ncbi:MAG: sulfotransferase, partial [Planctomycetota bacterium]|nr:sulfotransferase [Planctomycetota bacterium]
YFGSPQNFENYSRSVVEQFLTLTRIRLNPPETLVLKNPELTSHFVRLSAWFPQARFVVVVRDPRDTIVSMLDVADRQRESGQSSFLVGLGRDMQKFSAYFKSHYVNVLNQRASMEGRLVVVKYEDLVVEPSPILHQISRICGLTVPDSATQDDALQQQSMGAHEESKDQHAEAFWSPLYKEGITSSQVGRFRDQLSDEEISSIETTCADINALFHYW